MPVVREALQPIAPLGVEEFTLEAESGTDNFDFLLEGVPTLVANQEPANYMLNYHATSDTLDKVDIPGLRRHVAIAAATADALADHAERIGSRQSRDQVGKLLKDTGLELEMKLEGFWPMWRRVSAAACPDFPSIEEDYQSLASKMSLPALKLSRV